MEKEEGKYRYLVKNTILFTISSFGSKLLAFFLVPLYTNVLSTTDYGIADIITTTASVLIYILTINISASVMRFAIEDKKTPQRSLRYGLQVLLKGTVIMLSGTIFVWQYNLIKWDNYCYLFLVAIFFVQALEDIFLNYLRATDKVYIVVISGLLSTSTKLGSNIVTLLVFHCGIIGYLVSVIIGSVISITFLSFYILPLKKTNTTVIEDNKLYCEMRKYAIPAAINAVGWWVANGIDRYFLIWIKGVAINGIYSVAYKIPTMMSILCNIFSQAWGLSAIREYNSTDKTDGSNFYKNTYALFSAVLMLLCSLLIFLNVIISKLLFAKDFFEAWKYSSLLIVAMAFSGLGSYLGGIFSAAKHNSELAISMAISTVINIVLNMFLIPIYGALGAAAATVASYYVIWLLRYIMSKKYLRFKVNIFRDHIALCAIFIQIIMEHQYNHFYFGQAWVVLLIIFLYRKEMKGCFVLVMLFIENRKKNS